MNKTMLAIIKAILFTLMPVLLIFLSRDDSLKFIQQNSWIPGYWELGLLKIIFFAIGTILSVFLLTINLALKEIELNKVTRQRNAVIQLSRKNFLEMLKDVSDVSTLDMDVFVPHVDSRHLKDLVIDILCQCTYLISFGIIPYKRYFIAVEPLSCNKNLRFEIKPKNQGPQGLIGVCYQKLASVSKDNEQFELTREQKNIVDGWEFWLCVPDFDVDTAEIIISVFSKHPINDPEIVKTISQRMVNYAVDLNQNLLKKESTGPRARNL